MSDLMSTFFGPLDKQSCVYFLLLSILFFAMLVFAIITELLFVIKNFKTLDLRIVSSGILLLFNAFIAYFVNRLLYTICTKSLA
jgi:hypothetical protein